MFGTSHRFHANHGPWREEIWPMSQVLHGRIITAMSDGSWGDVEKIMRDIEVYRSDDGFNGGIGSSERYYDDNAWIGLAAMQAYGATDDPRYLAHAERTFKMVKSGEHKDGGLYWLEQDRSTRNTCAIAPAAELATHLYQATGKKEYLDFAVDQAEWLNKNLRLDSGLYGDNLGDDGKRNDHVYSYNQGTPIGLDVQLYKATGDAKYLARAKETATAAVKYYSDDGILWGDAPVFNTILFRNLMALDAIAPDPSYTKLLDKYLDRVWNEARNPETGLFSEGGIGTYVKDKRGAVIDQGALSQLFAIRALNRSQRAELT
jgi:predicted alpha-1,6-mannanase (GH76 family)